MNTHELFSRLPLPMEGRMPAFTGANEWLNSAPLTPADLHGKVVAVQFWTYTCINWLRTLPYFRAWAATYAAHGLVAVGVHTPEFDVEHDVDNVRRAAGEMHIDHAIAIDNDYAVWNAFANQYWPALYIVDREGHIRHHHFGEGGYERSEHVIRRLLADAGPTSSTSGELPTGLAPVEVAGIELAADSRNLRSPETYLGLARAVGFSSPELAELEEPTEFSVPRLLRVNQWALQGEWTVGRETAVSNAASGRIVYRFHARDLNLILTPPPGSGSGRFRVLLDGQAPGDAHGLDTDEHGNGVVDQPRLYQLIRQSGRIADRQFEIEFEGSGAAALCFTFG